MDAGKYKMDEQFLDFKLRTPDVVECCSALESSELIGKKDRSYWFTWPCRSIQRYHDLYWLGLALW